MVKSGYSIDEDPELLARVKELIRGHQKLLEAIGRL